jgi:hypothetical protein
MRGNSIPDYREMLRALVIEPGQQVLQTGEQVLARGSHHASQPKMAIRAQYWIRMNANSWCLGAP